MKRFFYIYGTSILVLFAYASYTGWTVTDFAESNNWGPKGKPSGFHK